MVIRRMGTRHVVEPATIVWLIWLALVYMDQAMAATSPTLVDALTLTTMTHRVRRRKLVSKPWRTVS